MTAVRIQSFIEPIFAWNVPLVSLMFLKRSLAFSTLLFSSVSLHWSLRKAFLPLRAIVWNTAFQWIYLSFYPLLLASLLSAICKASSDSHFALLHFFFLGMVLITTSCKMSWTLVHSSSGLPTIKSNAEVFPCFYLVSQLSQNHLWKTVSYFFTEFLCVLVGN